MLLVYLYCVFADEDRIVRMFLLFLCNGNGSEHKNGLRGLVNYMYVILGLAIDYNLHILFLAIKKIIIFSLFVQNINNLLYKKHNI